MTGNKTESIRILITQDIPVSEYVSLQLGHELQYYTPDPPAIYNTYLEAAIKAGCKIRKYKIIQEEINE